MASVNVGKSSKITRNVCRYSCSAPNLSHWTRFLRTIIPPLLNFRMSSLAWSNQIFHTTLVRDVVPALRQTLKSSEKPSMVPKCHEFHLDFTDIYRQQSQDSPADKVSPNKHNTVQNLLLRDQFAKTRDSIHCHSQSKGCNVVLCNPLLDTS